MSTFTFSQSNQENEIRNLEKMEGEAFAKKDTLALQRLLSPQLVVNTPLNRVATYEDVMNLTRAAKIDVSTDEKVIEKISFVKDIAIFMGHDIVKPLGGMDNAGITVTSKYTDIWMKDEKTLRLTVRQATIISV
ncbi:MAG: nuclear transport factor 2 family protein [Aquaticitalea sp.]